MAGAQQQLQMEEREAQKSLMATTKQHSNHYQWKVQFARCFSYPSSHPSQTSITTSSSPSLKPLKRSLFKPVWIPSSESSIVSLHPSADRSSSADSILTVSHQGTIVLILELEKGHNRVEFSASVLHFACERFRFDFVYNLMREEFLRSLEEHFISTLQFSWPQVSCLSGFPTRGSLVVLASYVDSSDEKQKFALRFPRISDVEHFIISLEDILSNKAPNGCPAVEVISAISSHSEIVPAYRPDTSCVKTSIYDSIPKNLCNEDQQDTATQDAVADSQSNVEAFPPRFTSLVSSCSSEPEQGKLALALADRPQDLDLKAQISKYMQDASFLDIVNKVNEVITELGGDFVV